MSCYDDVLGEVGAASVPVLYCACCPLQHTVSVMVLHLYPLGPVQKMGKSTTQFNISGTLLQ